MAEQDDEIMHEARTRDRWTDVATRVLRQRDPDHQRLSEMVGAAVSNALAAHAQGNPRSPALPRPRTELDDLFAEHRARIAEIAARGQEGMRALRERLDATAARWQEQKLWMQ